MGRSGVRWGGNVEWCELGVKRKSEVGGGEGE